MKLTPYKGDRADPCVMQYISMLEGDEGDTPSEFPPCVDHDLNLLGFLINDDTEIDLMPYVQLFIGTHKDGNEERRVAVVKNWAKELLPRLAPKQHAKDYPLLQERLQSLIFLPTGVSWGWSFSVLGWNVLVDSFKLEADFRGLLDALLVETPASCGITEPVAAEKELALA